MNGKTPTPDAPDGDAVGVGPHAPGARLLPAPYLPASWLCTLPVDTHGRLGVGFRMESGGIVRLSLDRECARHLAETVAEYLSGREPRPESGESAGPSQPLENRG